MTLPQTLQHFAPTHQTLSEFLQKPAESAKLLQESGQPLVLTVDSGTDLIVQDRRSFQEMLEYIDYLESLDGIRRGLQSVDQGRTRPLSVAFADLRKKHAIPG